MTLSEIVAEMRKLGVTEYRDASGVHVVLGEPVPPEDERSEDEQQRARDLREKKLIDHQMKVLRGATWGIGPPRNPTK